MSEFKGIDSNPFVNDLHNASGGSSGGGDPSSPPPPGSPYRSAPSVSGTTININAGGPQTYQAAAAAAPKGFLAFICKWMWLFIIIQMVCCSGYASLGATINLGVAFMALYHFKKGRLDKAKKWAILSLVLYFLIPIIFALLGGWKILIPFFLLGMIT